MSDLKLYLNMGYLFRFNLALSFHHSSHSSHLFNLVSLVSLVSLIGVGFDFVLVI